MLSLGLPLVSWPALVERLVVRHGGGGSLRRAVGRATAMLGSPLARRWVHSLRERSGAILHLNTIRAAFLAGDRMETVAEVRDMLAPPFFPWRMARLTAKRLERAAQLAVANSQFIADNLVAAGYPRERVVTIVPGLDLTALRPLSAAERARVREREGWPPHAFIVCCVGRLAEWKGQHLAVEALARVRGMLREARLVLVGDAGFDSSGYARRLHETARRLGVKGNVISLGFRDDAHLLMGAADAVLHTSVFPEPLGLTPMEAQALGVPVVASAAGGVLETVAHLETGYLFRSGDVEDLCRGLDWARDCNRLSFQRAARRRAESLFDIKVAVARYREIYQAL